MPNEEKADVLQMALNFVNNTTGLEGLCPTLGVYGAVRRPASFVSAPDQIARDQAIDAAWMSSLEV